MSDAFLISASLQSLLFPPGLSLLLLLLALLVRAPAKRSFFLALGLGTLYLSSVPATATWLRGHLEPYPPVPLEHSAAEAIVVLAADRYVEAPEYGGDTLYRFGLERARYAAWLHKKTGLPILVSGGAVLGEPVPEAELMKSVLNEFGVEVRWLESRSTNTYENARFSAAILKGAGIGEALLVTHAWHMPRAQEAFARAGLKTIPAPTGFHRPYAPGNPLNWLPSAESLLKTWLALHELVGRSWYRWQYYRASTTDPGHEP
ncbi:YdcF family protein [Methylococcus sp. EFPC2]|uniref:YdcF family protein n=1 Tax=Methylococcus sp. EFPC2 TaxID=2812648 RepID=UPI001967BB49|nr:YdcF family protein [Methylococcus sp. EFPC2]QSA96580.1 YdcF family protein [Methylococcus sp. EFPC2]